MRAGPHLVSGDTSDGDCQIAHDNGYAPADRWVHVLRLAAIRDAGGGACGSSNQCASAQRRAQSWKLGDMYLDCVYSAGIS